MKKILVVILMLLLLGCATQKSVKSRSWYVEYLEEDVGELEKEIEKLSNSNAELTENIQKYKIAYQTLTKIMEELAAIDTVKANEIFKKYK